ncbi:MAG: fructose-1,6-bisphosphatase [Treponema sp.]|nr:fructose-1,6-bisphosphatase [Treponema sp.]
MDTSKKYLEILARQYPSERAVISEIVNLQALLSLPKETEHFLSDIHGESEQFSHVLRNGSGSIRTKIDEVFGNSETASTKRALATLIYYPREKLELVHQTEPDMNDWYAVTLHRLIAMLRRVSSKHTRADLREAMASSSHTDFSYIIEELITEKEEINNKQAYYNEIIQTVIRVGAAEPLIEAMCNLIQHFVIDHLHIIGDIFDRGPGPHVILDTLMHYHSLDIQWGNHDVVWMGAALGNKACIANVVRLCARYDNLDVLEEGYGINLTPLVTFTMQAYGSMDRQALHKAIAVIQFKLEEEIIRLNPQFEMQDRLILENIDWEAGTVKIDGKSWKLNTTDFPTVDRKQPSALSAEEREVVGRLVYSFTHCEKLFNHVKLLYSKGSLYKVFNGNLLYHGCVPLDANGDFMPVRVFEKTCAGRELFDELEAWARKGFFARPGTADRDLGSTILWYLWSGPKSPLFGKHKMATFESMFIDDKRASVEIKNHYYDLVEQDEATVDRILAEFGLSGPCATIVNGHVPQEVKKGDTPIKCGGKLLIIDGGFAAAYHEKTGIAGYTLVCNSYGLRLVVHEKFTNARTVIQTDSDIISDTITVKKFPSRHYVADTDKGMVLKEQIAELEDLLAAYRSGLIGSSAL